MSPSDEDSNQSDDEATCPRCGETFVSDHGVKVHRKLSHEKTVKPVLECEWCGDEFEVKPNREDTAQFCSNTCRYASKRGRERPAAAELYKLHWKEGMSLNQLADHFDVAGHQTIARWFDHYNLGYRDNTAANRKLNRERDDWDEIVKPAHAAVRDAVENGEWHLQVDNPEHNGYGAGWTDEKKDRVREMYDRTCQACGLAESESLEEFGTKLDVHHIIPAGHFDDPEKRNAVENLVPLCRSCHRKWEGIPLRPEVVTA